MATGHRVSGPYKKNRRPAPLPKEVQRVADRLYVDRWGQRYAVIWNGQPGDPSITRDYPTEAST